MQHVSVVCNHRVICQKGKVTQTHHIRSSNDFGKERVLVCWVHSFLFLFFCPADGTCACKSSSQIRRNLLQLFPAARAEKLSQAGRGSHIKSVFLHNWPCVWSLGWKTLCLFLKATKTLSLLWRSLISTAVIVFLSLQ